MKFYFKIPSTKELVYLFGKSVLQWLGLSVLCVLSWLIISSIFLDAAETTRLFNVLFKMILAGLPIVFIYNFLKKSIVSLDKDKLNN